MIVKDKDDNEIEVDPYENLIGCINTESSYRVPDWVHQKTTEMECEWIETYSPRLYKRS